MPVPGKLTDITNYPEKAAVQILEFLGLDPTIPELVKTPQRVREWYSEFTEDPDLSYHLRDNLGTDFESSHQELVYETGLSFVSLCPHHLLPYSGTATIGYVPDGNKVVGISKLARALELITHRAIKQEDATTQLADALTTYLKPSGCMVILKAFHSCMGLRGVKQPNHRTGTSAVRGIFHEDSNLRSEFLRLIALP